MAFYRAESIRQCLSMGLCLICDKSIVTNIIINSTWINHTHQSVNLMGQFCEIGMYVIEITWDDFVNYYILE
jgi:hypothetical protein